MSNFSEPDEQIPTVEEFDQSKERMLLMGCDCENIIVDWEDGNDQWLWHSIHEETCTLWLSKKDTLS